MQNCKSVFHDLFSTKTNVVHFSSAYHASDDGFLVHLHYVMRKLIHFPPSCKKYIDNNERHFNMGTTVRFKKKKKILQILLPVAIFFILIITAFKHIIQLHALNLCFILFTDEI